MLLRPLFFTSFLLDDQLADDGLVERGPIVISSASSKTALAAAFLLTQRDGVEVIGLTSAPQPRVRRRSGSTTVSSPTRRSTRSATGPRPSSTSPAMPGCGSAVHAHYGDG